MYYKKGSRLVSRVTFDDSVRICLCILELVSYSNGLIVSLYRALRNGL